MIVADTSALVSLAVGDVPDDLFSEFDIHVTETVLDELRETSAYEDVYGRAARSVLDRRAALTVHDVDGESFTSSRIDAGEASCVELARDLDAGFLLTDDLRALPELEASVEASVAISSIVLRALVERETLDRAEARARLETIAESRDWLGAPIYRRTQRLFNE
jgi:rRNA-processing protein FCF1